MANAMGLGMPVLTNTTPFSEKLGGEGEIIPFCSPVQPELFYPFGEVPVHALIY